MTGEAAMAVVGFVDYKSQFYKKTPQLSAS